MHDREYADDLPFPLPHAALAFKRGEEGGSAVDLEAFGVAGLTDAGVALEEAFEQGLGFVI